MIFTLIGFLGMIFLGAWPWLQIWCRLRGKTQALGLLPCSSVVVGLFLYGIYSIYIRDPVYMTSNAQGLVSAGTLWFLVWRDRHER